MDNSLEIRYAVLEDIEQLRNIQHNDGFEHVYYLDQERLKNLFRRGEVFFIAQIDQKPVGFASVDFEVRARIHFLSVSVTAKGRKVGSALLLKILDECRSKGYKLAHTYVELDSNMENFLIKFGFKNSGIFKNQYGQGLDSSIWQIEL